MGCPAKPISLESARMSQPACTYIGEPDGFKETYTSRVGAHLFLSKYDKLGYTSGED